MLQSKLFGKTSKAAPRDEISLNAILLTRAGFIDKLSAGIYTYLPLGLRVLNKIKNIVREEMDAIGGQEILMPALLPKEPWEKTGRWTEPGKEVMFQLEGRSHKEYGLGWTHEEIITPLVKKFVSSYKDLPLYLYQIQDKFRNESRAKSGLLRGLEFSMKDLVDYYQKAMAAYQKIFERCGLNSLVAEASGGSFSKYSHEFQVLTPYGEDTIFYCEKCHYAQNKEIAEIKANSKCPECKGKIVEGKSIEVGNIFQLKTKYSKPFDLNYSDQDGKIKPVIMGCYGIGPSRVMGSVVEINRDDRGIIWPESVAPFRFHLLLLSENNQVAKNAEKIYNKLLDSGQEVLFDDRRDISAGQKFAESDLIGIPYRLVVSEKTGDKIEIKKRDEKKSELAEMKELLAQFVS
ncbi:MAG TPA: aminoacyl--tRNA ligase-related protein [Patescibacteria group bacterium]|nr:aminoacyl--tRNA ligase-related protein [Patescibacteria group bacterium]